MKISVKEETSREQLGHPGIDAELQAELQLAALPAGSWQEWSSTRWLEVNMDILGLRNFSSQPWLPWYVLLEAKAAGDLQRISYVST